MTERIFKSMMKLATISLLIGFSFIIGILYHHFEDEIYTQLKQEATYVSTAINTYGDSYLDSLNTNQRITLICPDGEVLFDNQATVSSMDNHLNREEIQEASSLGFGMSARYSDTLGEKTLYYAVKLDNDCILRIAEDQQSIITLLYQLAQPILIIFILVLVLSWMIAKRLVNVIIEPVNQIDLSEPMISNEYEELDPLLTRIHYLTNSLKEQMQDAKMHQKEFKMITDHMTEGFVIISSDLKILSYNESIRKHLNTNKDIDQDSIYVLSHQQEFIRFIDRTFAIGHDDWIQENDGRYYQWISNVVKTGNHIEGAVIIMMDVTEKANREQFRREFTANISHELKTPLTSISGFAEIIQNGLVLDEDITMFAGDIYKESQRLIHLVNDIIRISQLDDPSFVYQKEIMHLNNEIDAMIERFAPVASKKNIKIEAVGEPLELMTVPSILYEIIYNLVDNAIKYNKENGTVTIKHHIENNHIHISVKDTGVGIPTQDLEHVFERFYRVDKSRSSQNGGTGLGLSIVKHGVATLNGEIKLQSKLHEGTEITIVLPITD